MESRKYPFSSVQLDFPPEARDYFLSKTQGLIKKTDLYQPNTGRYGFEDRPHVTVLYGLHADMPSLELVNLIETYPRFTLVLGKISLFKGNQNNNDFDVVKAEIDCSDLHVLNSEIADMCEYTNDYPQYIPHATVAYVNHGTCDELQGSVAVQGLAIPVQELVFSSKTGYQRVIRLGVR